jgi:HAD superfamily hydrolase (TIGR01509 family)
VVIPAGGVLFDFGGTLDADGVTWKERMRGLCEAEGIRLPSERFDRAFYAADDALVGAVPATLTFRETVVRLANGLLRGLGHGDGGLVDRVAARFLEDALANLHRNAPVLAELAQRYRLGIVSNFYGNLDAVCDDAKISRYFGVIVDSARIGYQKPDPRIFHTALGALGLPPAEVTFVGDSGPRDMAGAKGVGMPHIWLVVERSAADAVCCPGDRIVESFGALEGLLL